MKGINLKQFKSWIEKQVGRKCRDYSFECLPCFAWDVYDKLEALEDWCKMLDDIDKKEIKKHN